VTIYSFPSSYAKSHIAPLDAVFDLLFRVNCQTLNSIIGTSLALPPAYPVRRILVLQGVPAMSRHISAIAFLILASALLVSCSGAPGGGCISNCGGNTSTLSLVLTATPPNPTLGVSIQAFTATITGITLTPSTGAAVNVSLNSSRYVAEFNRVSSDSTPLAIKVSVPVGNYTQITVTFSAPRVIFCTQATAGTPGCVAGTLGSVSGTAGTATMATNLSVSDSLSTGVALNVNLANTLTLSGLSITGVNFAAASVFTATVLPPSSALTDLSSGELSHVDDVMGLVTSASGSTLTIQTSTRGNITATANSSTQYSSVNCSSQNFSCVQANTVAIVDTLLNADGTFTLTFYQPLTTSSVDILEGVVTEVPNSVTNQFKIVVTDAVFASSSSLLRGQLNVGDQIQVTLNAPNPFTIVSKGLTVPAGSNFEHSTSVASILPGQTLALPVLTFSAQSGTTLGTASAQNVALRFTRFSAVMANPTLPVFSAVTFPPFFGLATAQQLQTTSGRLSVDGVSSLTSIPAGNTFSTTALYVGPPVAPAFTAQSVRAH
jgi:hypothetical protein